MLDPWYVTGFCDGEAAFTYSKTGNRNINLFFSIKIRGDDILLLEEIQEFFGVGKIYKVKPRLPRHNSGFTQVAALYRVNRIEELVKVVQHFDKYPLSSRKAKSYLIWKSMVLLKNERFRGPDFVRLQELTKELSAINSKNNFLRPKNA